MTYKPYSEISKGLEKWEIPYYELLSTIEWQDKRQKIISRDGGFCRTCKIGQSFKVGNNILSYTKGKELTVFMEGEWQVLNVPKPRADFRVLEVHHIHYVQNRLPWEYDDEELITLCNKCHKEHHKNFTVPIFDEISLKQLKYDIFECPRCDGHGYFSEYSHVNNGTCFKCNGARYFIRTENDGIEPFSFFKDYS